jgi:RNA polymerase sigma-54 factor
MQLGLDLNVSMKLEHTLSPQMIQSLKLLQVTALQLEAMVDQELQINPLLEQEEDIHSEIKEEKPGETKKEDSDDGDLKEESTGENKEDVDWDAFFEDGFDPGFRRTEEMQNPDNHFERVSVATRSLQDHLEGQLKYRHLSSSIRLLVEYLINCLDDDGYLRNEQQEVGQEYKQTLAEERPDFEEIQSIISGEKLESMASHDVREALHVLRKLDPPGIGARNLQECLLIQVSRGAACSPLALKILQEHFELLEKLKISAIAKKVGATPEQVQKALREVGALEPKPGRLLTQTLASPIIPDLIVELIDGEIELMHNDKYLPSLKISRNYSNLLKKGSRASTDEKKFVRDRLNSATWLIRAIEQRKSTMLRVMHAIIGSQPDFFKSGPTHLRPLILQDIAEKIEMHISTISRVINGKYVQTPNGIFELKYFFSSGVSQSGGGEDVSSIAVKDEIHKLIESEDPKKPFSDQKISDVLKVRGLDVARRTVAKYRDQLEILPARLRKQF